MPINISVPVFTSFVRLNWSWEKVSPDFSSCASRVQGTDVTSAVCSPIQWGQFWALHWDFVHKIDSECVPWHPGLFFPERAWITSLSSWQLRYLVSSLVPQQIMISPECPPKDRCPVPLPHYSLRVWPNVRLAQQPQSGHRDLKSQPVSKTPRRAFVATWRR